MENTKTLTFFPDKGILMENGFSVTQEEQSFHYKH